MLRVFGRAYGSIAKRPLFNTGDFQELMKNPGDHKDLIMESNLDVLTRAVFAMRHPYPKAKQHVMVLPTCILPNWKLLNETHLHLLYEMKERAGSVLQEYEVMLIMWSVWILMDDVD